MSRPPSRIDFGSSTGGRRAKEGFGCFMGEVGSQQGNNRNIQFLRGLAVTMVLFAHASVMLVGEEAAYWDGVLLKILPGAGVDLFS
ncbi:hypothetical protein [Stutzerimonas stutzeri]|uniref:hypothetical protein n=1 Tax=Stutzerimonas stutzeri TaxID=316 RepID=UPI00210C7627|nr:hypothetical protein [Stutzerimonas stutzeri]MCQ4258227.1 hypothetical protein [Stutzerimonas stutzeri]